jgi:hypothetical protein
MLQRTTPQPSRLCRFPSHPSVQTKLETAPKGFLFSVYLASSLPGSMQT